MRRARDRRGKPEPLKLRYVWLTSRGARFRAEICRETVRHAYRGELALRTDGCELYKVVDIATGACVGLHGQRATLSRNGRRTIREMQLRDVGAAMSSAAKGGRFA